MESSGARSRLLGNGDKDSTLLSSSSILLYNNPFGKQKQLSNFFSDNIYLTDEWHTEDYLNSVEEGNKGGDATWRLKERMKTSGVALIVCLNIGIDPPDVQKPNPCARKECWFDPTGQKQKGLEIIGNSLQQQYEKWQSKAKYKQCLDPTTEELRRVCMNLRKNSRGDRLLLHFNGHGVPRPTKNGELWVFGKHYTHYTPVAVCELRSWLGDPAIYVLDCNGAGVLVSHLVDSMAIKSGTGGFDLSMASPLGRQSIASSMGALGGMESSSIVLAACTGNENLPMNPQYPADLFTSCLTTPITIAIRWFILQNPYSMRDINPDIAENIPGKDNDRKTPRGELNWIFTAITDTIAWNTLPSKMFQKMFRQDLLVASLFRNFLLAKRIMKSLNCTPVSYPAMPDSTTHHLWHSWDLTLESFIVSNASLQKGASMVDPRNNMAFSAAPPTSNLSFFTEQLTAFELWLDFGQSYNEPPEHLPIVLQVLLSQTHRLRALLLLKRYLALGSEAVNLSLMVGIFPYILKLLQSPADDIKQILISIWASIIGFDASCRQELVREKSQSYFIQYLTAKGMPPGHRCLAAFVLAEICNNYKEGQQTCLQLGLHRSCTSILNLPDVQSSASLKRWICLCLYKLCEDFLWAKYLCVTEAGHTHLYPLLADVDPTVRAAAILALGEMFGASALTPAMNSGGNTPIRASSLSSSASLSQSTFLNAMEDKLKSPAAVMNQTGFEEKDLKEAELQLALQVLECCTDGSVIVRLEAVYALSKFFVQPAHMDCIKIVAKAINKRNKEKAVQRQAEGRSRVISPPIEASMQQSRINLVYPWHLSPAETKEITSLLESFIESKSGGLRSRGTSKDNIFAMAAEENKHLSSVKDSPVYASQRKTVPAAPMQHPQPSTLPKPVKDDDHHPMESNKPVSNPATPALSTLMASAYVRLWLALTEVQAKDPNSIISATAASIRSRINMLIQLDDQRQAAYSSGNAAKYSDDSYGDHMSRNIAMPESGSAAGSIQNLYASPFSNTSFLVNDQVMAQAGGGLIQSNSNGDLPTYAPPLSPLGFGSPSSTKNKHIRASGRIPKSSPFGGTEGSTSSANLSGLPKSASKTNISDMVSSSGGIVDGKKLRNTLASPGIAAMSGISASDKWIEGDVAPAAKEAEVSEEELYTVFTSNFYDMTKKLFLEPNMGFDPFKDSLSAEGSNRAYRNSRLMEVIAQENFLASVFKELDDRSDVLDRKSRNIVMDDASVKSSAVASLPPHMAKFEQKAILNIENTMMTSLVMFHAFQDVLAVSDGRSVGIWSLANCSKIMDIKNKQSSATASSSHRPQPSGADLFMSMTSSRITTMNWINESYDALLMVGSDDGVVKVWRDVATNDLISAANMNVGRESTSNIQATLYQNGGSGYSVAHHATPNCELATAFSALPDVAETSKGSGIVMSWRQSTGTLAVGGNSSSIRLWDLGREQCIRVFNSGSDTCLTAIASTTVPSRASNSINMTAATSDFNMSEHDNRPMSWIFAGFADGSTGAYDERVPTNGGKVHGARDHSAWIVAAHLRADIPEVITASMRGTVKFWDLRTMRTFKTLEVQKSPLTALAVHNCAPVMATGSHAQFIKILTLGGEQLGNIIKYHDGFLGQRIGPVSCLAFHPHRMLLAASSTDSIVSIYSTGDSHAN